MANTNDGVTGGLPVEAVAWNILAESMRRSSLALDRDGHELHVLDRVRLAHPAPARMRWVGEIAQLLRIRGHVFARIGHLRLETSELVLVHATGCNCGECIDDREHVR